VGCRTGAGSDDADPHPDRDTDPVADSQPLRNDDANAESLPEAVRPTDDGFD
jgi:hypothetical protein